MEIALLRHFKLRLRMIRGSRLVLTIQRRYLVAPNMLSKALITLRRLIHKFTFESCGRMTDEAVSKAAREEGFNLCRDSIGGIWSEISEAQFQIKPLSGGLTNYLYICSVPSHVTVPDNQPRSVLLRIYGDIASSSDFLIRNSVIFALMSEKGLGPRLYGMNPKGRIEELLPCKPLTTAQLADTRLSEMIAKKLAAFHSLDMPVCKEPRFLYHTLDTWMDQVDRILHRNCAAKDQPFINKFKSHNLRDQLRSLKGILSRVDSRVVFCHNDLQEGNILFHENCQDPDETLTVIDWEYCAYNYRGFDFGNHFCEWTCDYTVSEEPYFSRKPENYPSPEKKKVFFRSYLTQLGEEITDNVLEQMCLEADTFALASHFLWALWSIIQNDTSNIQFGFMEYGESRLQGYLEMKRDIEEQLKSG